MLLFWSRTVDIFNGWLAWLKCSAFYGRKRSNIFNPFCEIVYGRRKSSFSRPRSSIKERGACEEGWNVDATLTDGTPLPPPTSEKTGWEIPWLKKIIWVIGVLKRTVVSDWRFDNLCGSHLQSQVVVLVSWKFKNPCERFDFSVDRVAVGKCVMWLVVKTCAEIGYANRWVVKWTGHSTTLLWRWLPHRLSKRLSLTTVLLRTPITQMIFFNQGMLLLGSNHFLI